MGKMKTWWQQHKPSKRRLIQVYAALLYNAHLKGFIQGEIYQGPTKNLCVPGFNCYSCPGAIGACPLGALQNALASSGNRAPHYVLGILMLFGLILGRTICGWLCPLGMMQELLHKIPTPKLPKSRVTRALSYVKYGILAVFVIILPLMYAVQSLPVPAFCKYICPAGTFEGAIGLLSNPVNAEKFSMLGVLFTRKFIILVLIVTACVFVYRAFCRFLCPLGAIYGFFAKVALLGVKVEESRCTDCGRCVAHCKMDIRHVGDHECISCGECMDVCPTKAIQWKGGKITLHPNDIPETKEEASPMKASRLRSILTWGIALVFLVGVIWFANAPEASADPDPATPTPIIEATDVPPASAPDITPEPEATPEPIPEGKDIGMRCPAFTAPLYGEGGEFDLAQTRGKVTVINFWATWCTPCCAELPHFQRLQDTYPEDVMVIALHSFLVTDDVQAYLDKQPYTLAFALDRDGAIIRSLGGSTMLPMTVVLDREGRIVYNQVGSLTYEKLESLVLPVLE